MKENCRKKNLTTCERKISSCKPALRTTFLLNTPRRLLPLILFIKKGPRWKNRLKIISNFLSWFEVTSNFQSCFGPQISLLKKDFLLKKRLWHRCFPINFAKFLTPFLLNTSGRLLLKFELNLLQIIRCICSLFKNWIL